jgi:hypothetical protein
MSGQHSAGKGSRYRKVNQKQYDENWEKCFGKKKKVAKTTKKKEKNNG